MMSKRKSSAPPTRVRTAPTEDSEHVQPRRSNRQVTSRQCDDDRAKTRKIRADIPERTPSPNYNPDDPHDGVGPAILYPESARFKRIIEDLTADGENLKQKARRDRLKIFQDRLLSPPSPDTQNQTPGTRSQRGQSTRLAQSKTKTIVATDVDSAHISSRESSPLSSSKSVTDAGSDYQRTAESSSCDEIPEPADRGAGRPPPVNSNDLPLPWKGRLGYACLNTYLRAAKPSVFSSRTCRIDSIIKHRHPLRDPSQPEHPKNNPPDVTKKSDIKLGQKFVQELGLANARDISKMLRWNDKYNIKLFRLSSEMFPFASHADYGYRLAPFASEVLAEAGKVAAELGHRLTTHPGQFTQLGSPHKKVITASIRDLEYHDEMLSLLRLPEQQNRDAVMILHMGGVYEGKGATLDRFRQNYATLSDSIKARLVLENDDVSWSVHDLLPICEELNIPLVLDYHHHNIVFDSSQCREGTFDISQPQIMDRIAATWTRKRIRQKMHYSEPCPGAVTPRDRRKHSPRVATLPPCPPDMDLMIEAKDKEQAVFELMRNFKLPGFEKIRDMIPHERSDENPAKKAKKPVGKGKGKRTVKQDEADDMDVDGGDDGYEFVHDDDVAMGGSEGRVYWPPGREDWLKAAPKKKGKGKAIPDVDVNVKDEDEGVEGANMF